MLIYGAYGYTGELIAELAVGRGHRPVLAGRSAQKLGPLAERLGLEHRVVDLDDAAALKRALDGHDVCIHAAGPFIHTSRKVVDACLAVGAHYLDITGEVPVFAQTLARDAEARSRKVALISGAGFDVVPTDCLALFLKEQLPEATSLELAFHGMDALSGGTLRTMIEGASGSSQVRRDGALRSWPYERGAQRVAFAHDVRAWVVPIPWGDLETAFATTGIPNITTSMAFPGGIATTMWLTWPLGAALAPAMTALLRKPRVKRRLLAGIEGRARGPTASERAARTCRIWGQVRDGAGRTKQAWLKVADSYGFTAESTVRIAERLTQTKVAGATTPALALGANFVLEIPGSERFEALP